MERTTYVRRYWFRDLPWLVRGHEQMPIAIFKTDLCEVQKHLGGALGDQK